MKYLEFSIQNYRAINNELTINLTKSKLIPLVGINECGKTTILQAIYCFDYLNDNEYSGKHLSDTKNLYQTSEKYPPKIGAKIEVDFTTIENIYDSTIDAFAVAIKNENEPINDKITEAEERILLIEEDEEESETPEEEIATLKKTILTLKSSLKKDYESIPFPFTKKTFVNTFFLERNLLTKKYYINDWPNLPQFDEDFHDSLATDMIAHLPYILYNDDFIDRPPTSIDIPKEKPKVLNGWLDIYERLFEATSEDYSLFDIINETDTRRRDAILSDVQEVLNKTLSKAWKTFLLSNHGSITVKLTLIPNSTSTPNPFKLDIKIVEKIDSKERLFHVADRSKGFLWFFNFVMKLEFNPKINGESKNTVYLLDEPGSYLHYTAQEKLCQKLVDVSKKHGVVIYCTHSHTLLNPDIIPLNSIYIVEKDKSKRIKATPLPQVKTKIENTNAYQPIFEALQINALQMETKMTKFIAVEGIYDKYAIELFTQLNNDIGFFPGTSADSINKNIQLLLAFNKKYVAIWDNDTEGRIHYKRALIFFGEMEHKKMDLLPLGKRLSRRMEEMFESNDLEIIRSKLNLEKPSSYERIISALYFSANDIKKNILANISSNTRENFEILTKIISKKFDLYKEEVE